MKKDKWQNTDDQNIKFAMAFKALINMAFNNTATFMNYML